MVADAGIALILVALAAYTAGMLIVGISLLRRPGAGNVVLGLLVIGVALVPGFGVLYLFSALSGGMLY